MTRHEKRISIEIHHNSHGIAVLVSMAVSISPAKSIVRYDAHAEHVVLEHHPGANIILADEIVEKSLWVCDDASAATPD